MNTVDVIEQVEKICDSKTEIGNGWYCFIYRHVQFVSIPDSKNGTIRFSIPHLAKGSDCDKEQLEAAINETNRKMKYVKALVLKNGSIAINYDHKINKHDKACDIVPHMVMSLYCASVYLKQIIRSGFS